MLVNSHFKWNDYSNTFWLTKQWNDYSNKITIPFHPTKHSQYVSFSKTSYIFPCSLDQMVLNSSMMKKWNDYSNTFWLTKQWNDYSNKITIPFHPTKHSQYVSFSKTSYIFPCSLDQMVLNSSIIEEEFDRSKIIKK